MTASLLLALATGAALAWVVLRRRYPGVLRGPSAGLRVLMYHRVTEGAGARFRIPLPALRRQLDWLRAQGWPVVSLRAVLGALAGGPPLPPRAVLLTFDDGTDDARQLLHPLLRERGLTAVLFAVPGWAGTVHDEEEGPVRFLSADELREVSGSLEIGLHGFDHRDLSELPLAEVEADLRRAAAWFEAQRVPHQAALAYPYGRHPGDPARRPAFLEAVRRAGVEVAFGLGDRINRLPLATALEISRIEVRGDEPFATFRAKVRRGAAGRRGAARVLLRRSP